MEGPHSNFPRKPETDDFSAKLLVEFQEFVYQKQYGRPGVVRASRDNPVGALTIIANTINELKTADIIYFGNAVSFFCEISQSIAFSEIARPDSPEFIRLRKRMIAFLLKQTPTEKYELQTFLFLYSLLKVKEASYLTRKYREIKYKKYDEIDYLKSLPIPEAVAYVRRNLIGIS